MSHRWTLHTQCPSLSGVCSARERVHGLLTWSPLFPESTLGSRIKGLPGGGSINAPETQQNIIRDWSLGPGPL